jgi:hypothetical protein
MLPLNRRKVLSLLPASAAGFFLSQTRGALASTSAAGRQIEPYQGRLPWHTVFVGEDKFQRLCSEAQQQNWASLPIGQRTAAVGQALLGTPYKSFTLEIDDRIESPSVNLYGLDCWTFYEASLAFSRMIRSTPAPWTGQDLLRYIELERYRNGHCDGTYLSRMHHLEEVFYNNEGRGLGRNLTRSLGGVPIHREITEMQVAWKHYRYLSHNSDLRRGMAKVEERVSNLPVNYIPRGSVAGIESDIQSGDVLAIVSRDTSGYTSHVGLALRSGSTCRFMHATSSYDKGRRCIIDERISRYLADKSQDIGLIVFRPYEVTA